MDVTELRAALPVTERCAYFNTGASGPTHRAAVEAAESFIRRQGFEAPAAEGPYPHAYEAYESSRERIAGFVGAAPDEVALTTSTTDSINLVAAALALDRGDTVATTTLEHHSGTLPWDRMRDTRGIAVARAPIHGGAPDWDRFEEIAADATLVVTSAVDWEYGYRLPVREMTERAHDAGARVLVDAVQSIGQLPVDVADWDADLVAGSGHKWPLGPMGAGILYVKSGVEDWLTPERIGYRGVRDPPRRDYRYEEGARRFEVGSMTPAPHVGLAASMAALEDVGLDAIAARIESLTDRLKAGLDDEFVLGPGEYQSGLVTVDVEQPEAVVETLADRDIHVRSLPNGAVRASVHAFNTEEEVDRLVAALDDVTGVGA